MTDSLTGSNRDDVESVAGNAFAIQDGGRGHVTGGLVDGKQTAQGAVGERVRQRDVIWRDGRDPSHVTRGGQVLDHVTEVRRRGEGGRRGGGAAGRGPGGYRHDHGGGRRPRRAAEVPRDHREAVLGLVERPSDSQLADVAVQRERAAIVAGDEVVADLGVQSDIAVNLSRRRHGHSEAPTATTAAVASPSLYMDMVIARSGDR